MYDTPVLDDPYMGEWTGYYHTATTATTLHRKKGKQNKKNAKSTYTTEVFYFQDHLV